MGSDSDTPTPVKKVKKQHIKIENGGMMLSWRTLLTALVVVLGGGSSLGIVSFASQGYVDETVQESADKIEEKQKVRDDTLDTTLDQHSTSIKTNGKVIGEVKLDVNAIQKIQHQQVARDEARRVTEEIGNRSRRESEYDRLYRRNLTRLGNGLEPCPNVDCTN